MSNPIYNPVVPFTMGVSMQPGFMIYINGIPTGGRFFVNLKAGPDPQSDCVFHFNPRFDEGNVVVRNTQTGGHWGAEERNTNSPFPFVMGRQFEIILLCQANQYKVAVNGRHFVEYSHRSSYQSAKYLQVDGAVNLTMVRTDFETPKMPKVITNPSVPVTAIVPFNNIKNHKVTISGVPINHHPQRFHIDFRTAPEGNIFLHFNPRFTESQIVRNALLDRSWGGEERQLSVPFPFQYGIPYQVVPFTMGVSMQPGFMIYINGIPTGGRFSVNLKSGPDPQSDNVFHFNPRFNEGNVVVRNSNTGGRWGGEERNANSPFPFVMGRQFEIILLCQPNQYKVAVNGRHFVEFSHRVSYQSARYLHVEGSVNLTMVRTDFETPKVVVVVTAHDCYIDTGLTCFARSGSFTFVNEQSRMSIPLTATVPFNNIKNHKVIISGVPINHHPSRFHVNFRDRAGGNIFLHFNPRLNESQIVRNAQFEGSWGGEERQLSIPFPFQYGIPYQLTFHVEQQRFRVELNGMAVCSFPHRRRPLTQIRQIEVQGSTTVSRVEFV